MKGNHTLFSVCKTVICAVSVTILCDNFSDTYLFLVLHSSVTGEYFQIDPAPIKNHLSNQLQFLTQF